MQEAFKEEELKKLGINPDLLRESEGPGSSE
jgi:hypothetical protein